MERENLRLQGEIHLTMFQQEIVLTQIEFKREDGRLGAQLSGPLSEVRKLGALGDASQLLARVESEDGARTATLHLSAHADLARELAVILDAPSAIASPDWLENDAIAKLLFSLDRYASISISIVTQTGSGDGPSS